MTTIVRGAWLLAMTGEEPLRDGAVLIGGDGAIGEVGPFADLRTRHPDAEVAGDGTGIVMPGMVNGHTHLSECLIPGMGEDTTLWEWFERVVNPSGRVLTREDMRIGTRLKAAEMLLSGITTVNDMTCHRNLGSLASLGAVDGLAEMGMRGVVSFGAEDEYPGAPPADLFMAEHHALFERTAAEPLVGFRAGVGTVLGVTDELMSRTVAACRAHDWAVHTHLAEVREELTEARVRWGRSTIGHAADVGLLDHRVIAGHCIWCDAPDVEMMASRHVAACHNPAANMILASGVCPVGWLRRSGIPVALGTDGAASNDNQDMFFVLKSAALLQKVAALDPRVISAVDILEMATVEGARALGMDHLIGSLAPGKRADVVLLDGDTPELATIHDPHQQIVYCATARCVSDVWVDGVRRVADGSLTGADVRALAREAREQGTDLVARAGMEDISVLRPAEAARA